MPKTERIIQRELDNSSYLLVVDAVHDRRYRHDLDSGIVQVMNRLEFHVKQIAYCSVRIGCVANAVKLEIDEAQSGFRRLPAELFTLGKLNSVARRLHRVVTDLARVANRIQEVGRKRRLASRELH